MSFPWLRRKGNYPGPERPGLKVSLRLPNGTSLEVNIPESTLKVLLPLLLTLVVIGGVGGIGWMLLHLFPPPPSSNTEFRQR